MATFKIDGSLFKEMVISAAGYLEHNKEKLNDLNVFPVPDGDTGTNMFMTIMAAAKEVNAADTSNIANVTSALGTGALRGARGNSGVILSQIFRGFSGSVAPGQATMDAEGFALAIEQGVASAYKAVMKPKEGTILTVARAMAEEARRQADAGANLFALIDAVIDAGQAMLKRTPDMLPALKEAGVVDAGGAGLIIIYKGFKMAMDGDQYTSELDFSLDKPKAPIGGFAEISSEDIEFGYCTEFFITHLEEGVNEDTVERLRDKLANIGDSIVVVGDPELVKVHVHTNVPGKALQFALRLGQLTNIKIENMREQHSSILEAQAQAPAPAVPQKPIAVVGVAAGEGLGEIFKEMGVDELVAGGQSMNPSAEDIRAAVDKAPSDTVIVLPNNKNIILAAEQAQELTKKNIFVIPTKSFPQGLTAMLSFDPEGTGEDNYEAMKDALSSVSSGQITSAVRDSSVNGESIKEGELIGIKESDIVVHGGTFEEIAIGLLNTMVTEETGLISIYYGEGVTEEEAEVIREKCAAEFGGVDVELYFGGQAVYNYLLSAE